MKTVLPENAKYITHSALRATNAVDENLDYNNGF